jgi:putative DNA-invertase from lambdoid prophage Rac
MTAQTTPVQLGQQTPASMKRAVIYARVSTSDQSCARQIADLIDFAARAEYDVLDIHKETISGTKTNRHARNQVMALAQARKIDAVLVSELDTLNQLAGWNVSVVAMSGMTFELDSPHGRMMATMLAGIAQFERDLMSERIKSGLAAAKARGKKLGRQKGQRPKSDRLAPKVIALIEEGRSYRWIARDLGISKNTVLAIAKRETANQKQAQNL